MAYQTSKNLQKQLHSLLDA